MRLAPAMISVCHKVGSPVPIKGSELLRRLDGVLHSASHARDVPLSCRETVPGESGYHVKGEVNGCDAVAVKDDEPQQLAMVEMKRGFNLDLRGASGSKC